MLSLAGGLPNTGDDSLEWGHGTGDNAFGVTGDPSACSARAGGISVIWHGVDTDGVDWDASDGVAEAARIKSFSSKYSGFSRPELSSSDCLSPDRL